MLQPLLSSKNLEISTMPLVVEITKQYLDAFAGASHTVQCYAAHGVFPTLLRRNKHDYATVR
jgi:hypothetical protein